MNNFAKVHDSIATAQLMARLEQHPELWKEITARQNHRGSAHKDTEAIFLRWCAGSDIESVFTDLVAIDYPALIKLPEARSVLRSVMAYVGGIELGRAMIVNLKSGGQITPHIDEGAYADHYERFHVVLQSDPGNLFVVEHCVGMGEFVHMRAGECWWFNHKRKHWARNDSVNDRLHLIVDIVAPKYRRGRDD